MKTYTKDEMREILAKASPTSRVYVGCDSINSRRWTTYVTVVVLHIDGSRGCKLFPFVERERRLHSKRQILITEVHKATYMALELMDIIPADRMEVHCDINEDEKFASNAVLKEASSFVKGQQLTPKFKPYAIAASSAGDYLARRDRMRHGGKSA